MFSKNVAVDLGTANILVYVEGQGIVLREPSVAAVSTDGHRRVLAVGEEASRMLGRTPENMEAVRPLRDGVIADFKITGQMLRAFIKKAVKKKSIFSGFNMVICVPCSITESEKRAVQDAARHSGARQCYIAEEPVAAAIGANLPFNEPRGSMVVDIGGGTTEIAVVSVGGVVRSRSLRVGGVKMDDAIANYMKKQYNVFIGDKTAEEIKISIGSAMDCKDVSSMQVRGRDVVSGMPATIEITSREASYALNGIIMEMISEIHKVLEVTPPELSGDILQYGIMLTGGGALLHDLDERITYETGIPVHVAESPLDCVALGAGRIVEELDSLRRASR